MRNLTALLALACAGTQVAPGSTLLASTMIIGLQVGDHAHAVSVVADEGHLHLVLSHDQRSGPEPGDAAHQDGSATSTSERDHVFHLSGNDAANTTLRSSSLVPALAVSSAVAMFDPPPFWVGRPSPEPRARSSDLLRTAVLRL